MSARTAFSDGRSHSWLRWLALALVVISFGVVLAERGSLLAPPANVTPEESPSIVFVLIDTLRADYLGAYGFQGDVSPNFDRWAGEAVIFENAFSQAPWTKPSIASLFTSLHPEQHGVIAHGGRYGDRDDPSVEASKLPKRARTLAEELRAAGYSTAAFVANPWIQRRLGFGQGFEVFDARAVGGWDSASRVFAKARAWLAKRDRERPFFLYVHLMDVHGPYDAPRADYDALLASPSLGERRRLTDAEGARRRSYLMQKGGPHGDAMSLESWRASYAAGVRSTDRQLGEFLDALARQGILDDAVLVITSDHGEELADHGSWDHGATLYDEQIRVPLLVRLPNAVRGGARVDEVVSLIDLMPSLLSLAGRPSPAGIEGRDLTPLLAGRGWTEPSVAYSSGVKWRPDVRSVRTRERKLIHDGESGAVEVFDLREDPREVRSLRSEPDAKEPDLSVLLEKHVADLGRGPAFRPQAAQLDARTREKLRALGYLDEPLSPEPAERVRTSPERPDSDAKEERS